MTLSDALAALPADVAQDAQRRIHAVQSEMWPTIEAATAPFQASVDRMIETHEVDPAYVPARAALHAAWAEFNRRSNDVCRELGLPEAFPVGSGLAQE